MQTNGDTKRNERARAQLQVQANPGGRIVHAGGEIIMQKIVVDVNGNRYFRRWKPGPKPKGYVMVNIPVAYLEIMKAKNEQCGGLLPISEQIRQAIRGALCGLRYISLFKY